MEKKFIVKVDVPYPYCSKSDLENSYGKWEFYCYKDDMFFVVVIMFEPSREFPFESLKNVQIKSSFISNYSLSCVKSASFDLHENKYFYNWRFSNETQNYNNVVIEVDLSSLPLNPDLKLEKFNVENHVKKMLADGKLTDITIKTKDKNGDDNSIKAHNFFLSRSKVFDAMLNAHDTKEAQEGVILINDIKHEVIVEMVHYLYTDEAPKLKKMAVDLLMAANKYDIPGLMNDCVEFLTYNITLSTFSQILIAADLLELQNLKQEVMKFIAINREKVQLSEDWKQLKKNNIQLAFEVLEKNFFESKP